MRRFAGLGPVVVATVLEHQRTRLGRAHGRRHGVRGGSFSRVTGGGDFTSVGGITHRSVAGFATTNRALRSTAFFFPSDSQIIDLDISPTGDRLFADADTGAIDLSYRLPMTGFWGVPTISVNADALVMGGEFMSVNGVSLAGVAILPGTAGARTSSDLSFDPSWTSVIP